MRPIPEGSPVPGTTGSERLKWRMMIKDKLEGSMTKLREKGILDDENGQ